MQVQAGAISYTNAIAVGQYLRVKDNSGTIAIAGDEDDLGTAVQEYLATDAKIAVLPYNVPGTRKMVAGAAVAANAQVYAIAGGKIDDVGTRKRGYSLEAASADGDIIEVLTAPPWM